MAFRMPGRTFWLTFFGIPFPHTMAPFSLKVITDLLHVPAAILITAQPNSGRKQIVPLSKTLHSRRQTFVPKHILIRTWWSYCPQVQRAEWRKYSRKREPFTWGPNKLREGNLGGKKWSGKKGWQDTGPGVGTDPVCALNRKRDQEVTEQWMQARTGSEAREVRTSEPWGNLEPNPAHCICTNWEVGICFMFLIGRGKWKRKIVFHGLPCSYEVQILVSDLLVYRFGNIYIQCQNLNNPTRGHLAHKALDTV